MGVLVRPDCAVPRKVVVCYLLAPTPKFIEWILGYRGPISSIARFAETVDGCLSDPYAN